MSGSTVLNPPLMLDPIAQAVAKSYEWMVEKYRGTPIDHAALYGNLIAIGVREGLRELKNSNSVQPETQG